MQGMSDQTKTRPDRMPWAFAVGVAAIALGVIAGISGSAPGWVVAGVGLVLLCTGLIQRSIERSRR